MSDDDLGTHRRLRAEIAHRELIQGELDAARIVQDMTEQAMTNLSKRLDALAAKYERLSSVETARYVRAEDVAAALRDIIQDPA